MKPLKPMLPTLQISEGEFIRISTRHPDLRLELVDGEVFALPPTGGDSGRIEGAFTGELYIWSKKHPGTVYGPSTGFRLPNGNIRSADASVVLPANPCHGKRWRGYIRGVPDFLIEVRSPTDRMPRLRAKMQDWIQAGCQLAWLIDPVQKRVLIYTPSDYATPRVRTHAYTEELSAPEILPGLEILPVELDS